MAGLPKKGLLDQLLAAGKITAEQYEAARLHAEQNETRIEDALIDTGAVEEAVLLKWLSALYHTRFVSTAKLAKAEIERATLDLVPRKLAERLLVFPVLFDPRDKSLTFVLADADNPEIANQVKLAANVASVKAFLARPAAVRACIQKHYHGDIHAFGKLDPASYSQFKQMMDTYERNVFTEETMTGQVPLPRSGTGQVALPRSGTGQVPLPRGTGQVPLPRGATVIDAPPSYERQFSAEDLSSSRPDLSGRPRSQETGRRGPPEVPNSFATSVEAVNVLVSLLENQRQELRGHSAQVSRLMQKVGEHMGLSSHDVQALRLCGLLHDVGKTSSYHLTALNVAEYEGHRTQAKKCFMSPVRLFEAANLPKLCTEGLSFQYERFDGNGFPDRKAGKDIPLASRLLAIAETYADLTSNARNPFRKTLTARAAVEVLGRYKDKVFDPNLVDLFRVAALGEDMQSSLFDDRPRILLVDADAEETTVLELRLVEQGHEVILCRTAEQAYKRFQEGGVDALITEVELAPHDGFTLVSYVRRTRPGADLPVIFLTRRGDRASVDRGFELGAVDYIIKPASPDVVVAKARNVLQKAVRQRGMRGVSGSLKEMPLPDVLQVLSRTRKSGLLKISSDGGYAGEIHFGGGEIHDAMFQNLRGQEALYALLALTDGEFALDPTFVPTSRVIHESTEHLLLEGMRRMDEVAADAGPPVDFSVTRIDDR